LTYVTNAVDIIYVNVRTTREAYVVDGVKIKTCTFLLLKTRCIVYSIENSWYQRLLLLH